MGTQQNLRNMLAWWHSCGVMSCTSTPRYASPFAALMARLIRGYPCLPPIGGFYVPSSKNFDAVALVSKTISFSLHI